MSEMSVPCTEHDLREMLGTILRSRTRAQHMPASQPRSKPPNAPQPKNADSVTRWGALRLAWVRFRQKLTEFARDEG